MGKYIGHRLVARPELDSTFWTDIVHAYSRDSCPLPCDVASNISLRNILNSARVQQILPRVTSAYNRLAEKY